MDVEPAKKLEGSRSDAPCPFFAYVRFEAAQLHKYGGTIRMARTMTSAIRCSGYEA